MTTPPVSEPPLTWSPSRLAGRVALCAAAALAAAILTRSTELVAFAAPLLGALAAAAVPAHPTTLTVDSPQNEQRCFEGDIVDVSVRARVRAPRATISVRLSRTDDLEVLDTSVWPVPDGIAGRWRVRTPRWGVFEPVITTRVYACGGLLVGTGRAHPARLRVYPRADATLEVPYGARLPDRIGAHVSRRAGGGVEFAGIRPYSPGDEVRTINWPATARRGRLHVTQRLAEHSADIVTLIDTYALHAEPTDAVSSRHARSATELAALGATQLVQASLALGDRAGVLVVGGRLRRLGPDIGRRQFYRVLDTVLDAYPSAHGTHEHGTGHSDLIPRGALPPRSMVVAFTPLLDGRIALSLGNLRLRGHPVVCVDVLRDIPRTGGGEVDPLVVRLWRLERRSMHRNFALLGIPVVQWRAESSLEEAFGPVLARPIRTGRRPS